MCAVCFVCAYECVGYLHNHRREFIIISVGLRRERRKKNVTAIHTYIHIYKECVWATLHQTREFGTLPHPTVGFFFTFLLHNIFTTLALPPGAHHTLRYILFRALIPCNNGWRHWCMQFLHSPACTCIHKNYLFNALVDQCFFFENCDRFVSFFYSPPTTPLPQTGGTCFSRG